MSKRWKGLILIAGGLVIVATSGIASTKTAQSPDDVGISTLVWSPDGSRIATVNHAGAIAVVDATSGEKHIEFNGLIVPINGLTWSPDGTRLASASPADGVIRIWNSSNGDLIAELQSDKTTEGPAFAQWNPISNLLVSVASSTDGGYPLRVWNTEDGDYQLIDSSKNVGAYDIAWTLDGTQVAVANYFTGIELFADFSSQSPQLYTTLPFGFPIAWSPFNDQVAMVDNMTTGNIQILDVTTGLIMLAIEGPKKRNGYSSIGALAWSPDGRLLAGDDFNGNIHLWNPNTGENVDTLVLNRQGSISVMSWSPYGGTIAAGDSVTSNFTVEPKNASRFTPARLLGDSLIQIVVPAPSQERVEAIAAACVTEADARTALAPSLSSGDTGGFAAAVEALPEEAIPAGCAADLLAVAAALEAGG